MIRFEGSNISQSVSHSLNQSTNQERGWVWQFTSWEISD